uniref:Uncharacterized protein n=1 Tax=Trichogramma kaykai TaxID=54128 RepID=A0ABD2X0W9_9HYME
MIGIVQRAIDAINYKFCGIPTQCLIESTNCSAVKFFISGLRNDINAPLINSQFERLEDAVQVTLEVETEIKLYRNRSTATNNVLRTTSHAITKEEAEPTHTLKCHQRQKRKHDRLHCGHCQRDGHTEERCWKKNKPKHLNWNQGHPTGGKTIY